MSLTQRNINKVKQKCSKTWSEIIDLGYGVIEYAQDGVIYASTQDSNNNLVDYPITKTCCEILSKFAANDPNTPVNVIPENIYFDLDEQKCRWTKQNLELCSTEITPIKIVLNPVGNDGAFFNLTENDTCSLKVKFNYLFKLNCGDLVNVIKFAEAVGLTSSSGAASIAARDISQSKFEEESKLFEIDSELTNLVNQNANLNYSIICEKFPINDVEPPIVESEISPKQKLPFSNTGFGSLTNDLSLNDKKQEALYNTKTVNFCLTDTGLNSWRLIIGENNYSNFLNGDPNSYTCSDVILIYELNEKAILEYQPILLFECETPFGEKTKTINRITELSNQKIKLLSDINKKEEQLNELSVIGNSTICSTLLGQFESLSADVTLDMVDDNGVTTQFYSQTLFNPIANLYNYLVENIDNTGFLVCGEPNINETWTSGCTGLIYPEFTNGTFNLDNMSNVSICETIKDILYDELFNNSGLSNLNDFNSSLSPNAFNSNWLTYETIIDDQEIISGITNNQVKLNIVINSSCGNICILVDEIDMTKICNDADRTNIFISKSPGFNLYKVIDNKKSWLQADSKTNRNFYIANYDDSNKIRQTEYSVDEEKLILNSKEIDLTMNMASAVENDVWCYLLDNPNLLTGTTCDTTSGVTPTDIYGNLIILPTAQTYTYNVSDVIDLALKYYENCLKYAEAVGLTPETGGVITEIGTEGTGLICFPQSECMPCGRALKFKGSTGEETNLDDFTELWVVCDVNGLSVYHITDTTDSQNTINNITYSLTGSAISELTDLANTIYLGIIENFGYTPPYEIFWDSIGNCTSSCKNCEDNIINCGDKTIDFTGFMITNITEVNTLETFENLMVSELTDAKNRKVLSSYPILRAVYDRYMNATEYGLISSNEFDYNKMDEFTSVVKTYWDDLIEQVVPATTIWGSTKVYTNTLFDQQKYKYRSYTTLFCNSPLNFITPPSPINGSEGQCEEVEVIVQNLQDVSGTTIISKNKQIFNSVCLSQMNYGSEFIGNVDIKDGSDVYVNYDDFCKTCDKNIRWYNMVDKPEHMMQAMVCYPEIISITAITYIITSLIVNNIEYVPTTLSSTTVTPSNINFVAANNNIISGCTLGGVTGLTYTNFVDFLNETFQNLGLIGYTAILSLKEKDGISNNCSKNGFYISYPKTDTFSIIMDSDSDFFGTNYNYTNLALFVNNSSLQQYYCSTDENINYDCLKNTVNE
jgi:hypothetical protein